MLNSTARPSHGDYAVGEVPMTQLVYRPPPPPAESFPVPPAAVARALPVPEVFELSADRWDRWIAKGREHDRNVKRRLQLVACVAAILAVTVLVWVL